MNHHGKLIPALALAILAAGCATVDVKQVGRSATEQLLTSVSAEEAVAQIQISDIVSGKYTFVEVIGLNPKDTPYVRSLMEQHVLASGGKITGDRGKATVLLHTMAGSTGTDTTLGKIFLPIPVPNLATGIAVSELDFYRRSTQTGRTRLWVYATSPTGELIHTTSPAFAERYVTNRNIFGMTIGSSTDLVELDKGFINPGEMPSLSRREGQNDMKEK